MVPFVVVGHPRSGSTLLKETLAQHERVKIHGELFHAVEEERRKRHFVRRQGDKVVYYQGGDQDAIDFLQRNVWNRAAQRYAAVGYKLFSEHVECAGTRGLLARLAAVEGLRVVNIVRSNLLDMWVSRTMAEQSGVWREAAVPKAPQPPRRLTPVEVSPEALQTYFEHLSGGTDEIRGVFAGKPYLEVDYDALSGDFQRTMDSVFAFLSVEAVPCSMTTRKQNTVPRADFITNYSALKSHFATSRYAAFFQD